VSWSHIQAERLFESQNSPLRRGVRNGGKRLNSFLCAVYGLGIRFWYATLPQRPPGDIKKEMVLHRKVIQAVKRQDPEQAARAMLVIIAGFPDRVANLIRGEHGGAFAQPARCKSVMVQSFPVRRNGSHANETPYARGVGALALNLDRARLPTSR
jgi:hypothetical protein